MNIKAFFPRTALRRAARTAAPLLALLLALMVLGACAASQAEVAWRGQYDMAIGGTSFKR